MPLAPAFPPAPAAAGCARLLAPAYQRLVTLCPALDVQVAALRSRIGPDWVDGAELAADGGVLDAFLAAEAARILNRDQHVARPDVVASRALHGYLWSVCLLMSGPWYLRRRVPLLRPRDIRIDPGTGALAVVPGAFTCLSDDPAAGMTAVRVVADAAALRAALLTTVTDHVRPLLAALGPHLRRGPRALWGMVGDDLISGIWHLGRALGEEERAVRLAGELLPGPVPPFPGGADFRRLTDPAGGSRLTRTRLGCCLHYTVRPAETCGTCPRLTDTARLSPADAVPGP